MSLESALKLLKERHLAYLEKAFAINPSAEDQLLDARIRGKIEAYEEVVGILTDER